MASTSPGLAVAAVVGVLVVVVIVLAILFYTKKQSPGFRKNYRQPIKNGSRLRIKSLATGGYLQWDKANACDGDNRLICNATRTAATLWTAYLCNNCFIRRKKKKGNAERKAPPREIINGSWLFYTTTGTEVWAIVAPVKKPYTVTVSKLDALPNESSNTVTYSAFFTLRSPANVFPSNPNAINGGTVFTAFAPERTLSAVGVEDTTIPDSPCATVVTLSDDPVRSAFLLEPL